MYTVQWCMLLHDIYWFAVATVIVLILKHKKWQLPVLSAAALVGYSRIYLAQHFLIDVIIGSITGCLSGIAAVYLMAAINKFAGTYRKIKDKEVELADPIAVPIRAA